MNSTVKSEALHLLGVQRGTRFMPNGGMHMYFWHEEEKEADGDTTLTFMIEGKVFSFTAGLSVRWSEEEENVVIQLCFSGNGSVSMPIAIRVSQTVNNYRDREPNVGVEDITYAASDTHWLQCQILCLEKEGVNAINNMKWLTNGIMQTLIGLGAVYVPKK